MEAEPMKLKADELHKVHAAHDATQKGWRVDVEGETWRTEGQASGEVKKAMALRLATCWNVLEGIPTAALLSGVVLDFYRAADELARAVDAGIAAKALTAETLLPLIAKLRAADVAHVIEAVECTSCDAKHAKGEHDEPEDEEPEEDEPPPRARREKNAPLIDWLPVEAKSTSGTVPLTGDAFWANCNSYGGTDKQGRQFLRGEDARDTLDGIKRCETAALSRRPFWGVRCTSAKCGHAYEQYNAEKPRESCKKCGEPCTVEQRGMGGDWLQDVPDMAGKAKRAKAAAAPAADDTADLFGGA